MKSATRGMSVSARIGWYTGPREPNGCRLWLGGADQAGYPHVNMDGHKTSVGRAILGLKFGDPRFAMHSCDTPGCVEPSHLRAGTVSENAIDSVRKGRQNQIRKTHCANGHEFSPENTRFLMRRSRPEVDRICRVCDMASKKLARRGMAVAS